VAGVGGVRARGPGDGGAHGAGRFCDLRGRFAVVTGHPAGSIYEFRGQDPDEASLSPVTGPRALRTGRPSFWVLPRSR